jgi:competence protein ComGC
MSNRKKLIELFIYVLIIVVGIILLLTTNLKGQELQVGNTRNGGVTSAAVSLQ